MDHDGILSRCSFLLDRVDLIRGDDPVLHQSVPPMLIERQHEGSAIGTPDLPIPSIDECGHHDDTDHDTATCQGDRPCGQGEGSFFDEDHHLREHGDLRCRSVERPIVVPAIDDEIEVLMGDLTRTP